MVQGAAPADAYAATPQVTEMLKAGIKGRR
jgi:hypothetical protein